MFHGNFEFMKKSVIFTIAALVVLGPSLAIAYAKTGSKDWCSYRSDAPQPFYRCHYDDYITCKKSIQTNSDNACIHKSELR